MRAPSRFSGRLKTRRKLFEPSTTNLPDLGLRSRIQRTSYAAALSTFPCRVQKLGRDQRLGPCSLQVWGLECLDPF